MAQNSEVEMEDAAVRLLAVIAKPMMSLLRTRENSLTKVQIAAGIMAVDSDIAKQTHFVRNWGSPEHHGHDRDAGALQKGGAFEGSTGVLM